MKISDIFHKKINLFISFKLSPSKCQGLFSVNKKNIIS